MSFTMKPQDVSGNKEMTLHKGILTITWDEYNSSSKTWDKKSIQVQLNNTECLVWSTAFKNEAPER